MTFKQKVYEHYLQLINERKAMLQQVLADLKESGANETKSTAGDKHETALAMLQIEQANKRAQLKEATDIKIILEKIDASLTPTVIVSGSLVNTDKGYLFVSVALGRVVVDGKQVIALSPQSPLGMQLMGLKEKDTATVNGNTYVIEGIE